MEYVNPVVSYEETNDLTEQCFNLKPNYMIEDFDELVEKDEDEKEES